MQVCPHCEKEGITDWQKVLSVTFRPAECRFCHGRSYVHVMNGLVAMTAWIVLTWVCIGLSYLFRNSVFLLGSIPALYLAVEKYLLGARLTAIRRY